MMPTGVALTVLGSTIAAFFAIVQRRAFQRGTGPDDRAHESVLMAGTNVVAAALLFTVFLLSYHP